MLGSLAHSLSCACILSYHFIGTSTTIFLIRCCTSQFQHFLHCLCIAKTFLQAIDVLQSRPCFETSAPAVHTNKPTTHACVRVCVCACVCVCVRVRVRVCVCARTKKNFFSGPFLFVGCLFYPEKNGVKTCRNIYVILLGYATSLGFSRAFSMHQITSLVHTATHTVRGEGREKKRHIQFL